MNDLLIEYIQSANDLKKRIEKYEEEHKEVLENTKVRKRDLVDVKCQVTNNLRTLRSMYNEQLFIINWLKSGHNPNEHQAIDKRTVYLVDYKTLEAVIDDEHYKKVSNDEYTDYITDDKHEVHKILTNLSDREINVFLMIDCEKLSFQEVAELLNVSKGSIQKFYERCKHKIKINLEDERAKRLLKQSKGFKVDKFNALLLLSSYNFKTKELSFPGGECDELIIVRYILRQLKTSHHRWFMYKQFTSMSYDDLSKKYDVKAETIERNHLQAINHIREILDEKPIPITKRVNKKSVK